jgi:putative solute:sodium symporter small subunit
MLPERLGWWRVCLLAVWALASFGLVFLSRSLQFSIAGWPFHFWLAAQGIVYFFVLLVVVWAVVENRRDAARSRDTANDEVTLL